MAEAERLAVDLTEVASAVLDRAVAELRAGRLLIYPTDTLYAFGGAALAPGVAERVRVAKGRDEGKPLPLVAGDEEQARDLASEWSEAAARLAARFWTRAAHAGPSREPARARGRHGRGARCGRSGAGPRR